MFPWILCQFIERESRYSAFGVVSRLRTGQRGTINAISGKEKNLSFLYICQTDSLDPHAAFCQMGTGACVPAVKRQWRQNWKFTPSTAWSRMGGVIYPLTHWSLCDCLVNTEMRRPVGRPELWYKVGRKLRDPSTFIIWCFSDRVS